MDNIKDFERAVKNEINDLKAFIGTDPEILMISEERYLWLRKESGNDFTWLKKETNKEPITYLGLTVKPRPELAFDNIIVLRKIYE